MRAGGENRFQVMGFRFQVKAFEALEIRFDAQ